MSMTTGVPTAAATCIGPVSFETKRERRAAAAASCGTVRRSRTTAEGGNLGRASRTSRRSSGPAKTTARTESLRSNLHASSAKRSTGQRRLGWPAPGKMPTSVESVRRARKEAEQVRLREAVQVYDEVEAAAAHFEHEFADLPEGEVLRPVAHPDAVNRQGVVGDARQLDDRRGGAADGDRHARAWKPSADGCERGQAQHDVAQLPEVY